MMLLKANLLTGLILHTARQPIYNDNSEVEDKFVFSNHRLAKGGGR